MMLYNKREVSMVKFLRVTGLTLISSFFMATVFMGCGGPPKPNAEDSAKLNEAKAAAESAERKLSALRMERMQLEQQLEGSQSEEQNQEQELQKVQGK
jgi:hypothetical protein